MKTILLLLALITTVILMLAYHNRFAISEWIDIFFGGPHIRKEKTRITNCDLDGTVHFRIGDYGCELKLSPGQLAVVGPEITVAFIVGILPWSRQYIPLTVERTP